MTENIQISTDGGKEWVEFPLYVTPEEYCISNRELFFRATVTKIEGNRIFFDEDSPLESFEVSDNDTSTFEIGKEYDFKLEK
jgi:hypothetical protein